LYEFSIIYVKLKLIMSFLIVDVTFGALISSPPLQITRPK